MATIRITNLKLRTIIGTFDWERKVKQDLLINISFECKTVKAAKSDSIKDAVDYKAITKRIIKEVEGSRFKLIEALSEHVLDIVLSDKRITSATVRVDKPGALRFADSVSIEVSKKRK